MCIPVHTRRRQATTVWIRPQAVLFMSVHVDMLTTAGLERSVFDMVLRAACPIAIVWQPSPPAC
jgi:hypothetical protein